MSPDAGGRLTAAESVVPPSAATEDSELAMREAEDTDNMGQSSPQTINRQRKLHYTAAVSIRVSQLNKAIEQAMALAQQFDGYIETINANIVVMQIPVLRFNDALAAAAELGKVLDKSVTTEDISDAFYDTQLRLKIARQSRDRLLQLLQAAKEEDDKLALLKQLEAVNLKINTLQTALESLNKKIQYAQITLTFRNFQEEIEQGRARDFSGLQWIHLLANFNDNNCEGSKLSFHIPDKMIKIDHLDYWRVESADEVVFYACQRENQPHGDGVFWKRAIDFRMQQRFSDITHFSSGHFDVVRLTNSQKDAAVFYLGIEVVDDKLNWLEVSFPNSALEQKYKDAIRQSIAGGYDGK